MQVQENEEVPRVGKASIYKGEQEALAKVSTVETNLLNQAINTQKGVVFSEWEFRFTNHDGRIFRLLEVSIQYWNNGKVEREKFYYKKILQVN